MITREKFTKELSGVIRSMCNKENSTEGLIEYRIKSVERFIVTRYEKRNDGSVRVRQIGQTFDNISDAHDVGHAMAFFDREFLGLPPGDKKVIFPKASLKEARG